MTHGYSPASQRGETGSDPANTGCVVDLMEMRHIFLGVLQFSIYNIIATVIHAISFIYHGRNINSVIDTSLSNALKT